MFQDEETISLLFPGKMGFILLNEDIDAVSTGINEPSGYPVPGTRPGQPGYLHRASR